MPSLLSLLCVVQLEEIDEGFLHKFSKMCAGDVSPMQAVIGSITAQEVVKVSQFSCLGKDSSKTKKNFFY